MAKGIGYHGPGPPGQGEAPARFYQLLGELRETFELVLESRGMAAEHSLVSQANDLSRPQRITWDDSGTLVHAAQEAQERTRSGRDTPQVGAMRSHASCRSDFSFTSHHLGPTTVGHGFSSAIQQDLTPVMHQDSRESQSRAATPVATNGSSRDSGHKDSRRKSSKISAAKHSSLHRTKTGESLGKLSNRSGSRHGPLVSKEELADQERGMTSTIRQAKLNQSKSRLNEKTGNASALQRIMLHPLADYVSCFLIFANVVILNLEVELELRAGGPKTDEHLFAFTVVNMVLNFFFITEVSLHALAFRNPASICDVSLRALANGIRSLAESEHSTSNILDFVCALGSVFEICMGLFLLGQTARSDAGAFTNTVQMLRLLRLFRSTRILRFCGPLRILILQILSALKSVVWAFVLLIVIIYIFSLLLGVCIISASPSAETGTGVNEGGLHAGENPKAYWSTLLNIMVSLFLAVTGGFDWENPVAYLKDSSEFMFWIFVAYISVIIFAVLNVVTGVFCQKAIKYASEDLENLVMEHFVEKRNYLEKTKAFFELLDTDDSNELDLQELQNTELDEKVSGYLAFMGLEVESWGDLLQLLDVDGDGKVDSQEFMDGIVRLRGPAKSLDMARLLVESKTTRYLLERVTSNLEHALSMLPRAVERRLSLSGSQHWGSGGEELGDDLKEAKMDTMGSLQEDFGTSLSTGKHRRFSEIPEESQNDKEEAKSEDGERVASTRSKVGYGRRSLGSAGSLLADVADSAKSGAHGPVPSEEAPKQPWWVGMDNVTCLRSGRGGSMETDFRMQPSLSELRPGDGSAETRPEQTPKKTARSKQKRPKDIS